MRRTLAEAARVYGKPSLKTATRNRAGVKTLRYAMGCRLLLHPLKSARLLLCMCLQPVILCVKIMQPAAAVPQSA